MLWWSRPGKVGASRTNQETFFDLNWGNRAVSGRYDRIFSPTLFGRLMVVHSEYESTSSANFFDTPVLFANGIQDLTARADLTHSSFRRNLQRLRIDRSSHLSIFSHLNH